MVVYVQKNGAYGEITDISLSQLRNSWIKASLENAKIDLSLLDHYKLVEKEDDLPQLVYDEEHYKEIEAAKKKSAAIVEGNRHLETIRDVLALEAASDDDAYIMRYLYEEWAPDMQYDVGERVLHGDNLYKCKQAHVSQAQYTPDLIPALWDIVGADDSGSIDNPVEVPDTVSSMVYVKGKYYLEDGVLYLMNRQGMEDGEEVSLTYKPSQLVGQYFAVVEQ